MKECRYRSTERERESAISIREVVTLSLDAAMPPFQFQDDLWLVNYGLRYCGKTCAAFPRLAANHAPFSCVFVCSAHLRKARRSVSATEENNSQGTLVTKQEFYIMYEEGGRERKKCVAVFFCSGPGRRCATCTD